MVYVRSINELKQMLTITTWIQIPSHSGKIALFVLNLFLSLRPVSANQEPVLDTATIEAQRSMVEVLSGALPITEDVYLQSRSSAKERALAAEFLYAQLANAGLNPERHEYKVSNKLAVLDLFFDPYIGTNVYTTIPSTVGSKEYVVLGAHYDSEPGSPGANDNATGVSLAYEVAAKLKRLRHREKNFIIVFFDQEEDGLIGSQAFAQKLRSEGLCVHSVHTTDMVGWDGDSDGAVELELPTESLEALYAKAAKKLNIPVYKTAVNSSDHAAFRELGYQAVGISEEYANGDTTPHYHKPTDTVETVNFQYLAQTTHLVWEVMKSLATITKAQDL